MHFPVTSPHCILLAKGTKSSTRYTFCLLCFCFLFFSFDFYSFCFCFCFVSFLFSFFGLFCIFFFAFLVVVVVFLCTILVLFTRKFSSQPDWESKNKTFFFRFLIYFVVFFTFFGSIFLYCFSHIHMYVLGAVRSRILQNETACFLELGEFCFVRAFHLISPL